MQVCQASINVSFTFDCHTSAVQAVDRALLVDILPPSEQPDGNAWAARMLGVGSVAGYFMSVSTRLLQTPSTHRLGTAATLT